MSLADLPDVLIAHLTTYLDYSDVCNLMETSKKNYNAIEAYKKDKIQCRSFRKFFSLTEENNPINCTADGDINDANVSYSERKSYTFNTNKLGADKVDNIAKILDECAYVPDMDLYRMTVTGEILKMLNNTKNKIGSISIIRGYVNSGPEEFITFCQKYGICNFKYTGFCDDLWTDDVFVKVIPHVMFDNYDDNYDGSQIRHLQLTDHTLKAIFERCGYFEIPGVVTSFTINGLVNALQILREGVQKHGYLDIGVFLPSELAAANRYFNKETGELKDLYQIEIDNYNGRQDYTIKTKNLTLYFCVNKR